MKCRKASSTMETVVAVVLLGSAIALVGSFVASVNQGLADRELSARIGWEIANAREIVGSWNPVAVTEERIEALPVAESITSRLPDAKWAAQVTPITEPVAAWQVTLQLTCTYQGQAAAPEELTFWIEREVLRD